MRATDTLFDEYTEWYYEKTENSDYHQVCRDIRKLEDALYKGSRFEAINSAKLADFCYLAVPENVVHPHELASNWGLIWVREDKTLEIITPALNQHCSQGSQLHLIQNIAIAASENVYFANGIIEKDGVIHFLRPPRRRRISKGKFK